MPGLTTAFAQGLAANRPAASASNSGFYWLSTDTAGGTLYQSTGSAWVQVAAAVNAPANPLTQKGDLIAAATGGTQTRLGVGSDNQVLTADSAQTLGVKWAAAGATSVTTKGDLQGYDTAANRIAVGTDGQVLTADSTQALGLKWAAAPAASLSTASASLGADVTMTSANTFYDGPSLSLAAGTWLVIAHLTLTTQQNDVTAKIWDGTTVYSSIGGIQAYISAVTPLGLTLSAIVTLGSTTTIKVSAAADGTTGSKIKAASPFNGAGNNASQINALKVA